MTLGNVPPDGVWAHHNSKRRMCIRTLDCYARHRTC
jgi:hypothetical protein